MSSQSDCSQRSSIVLNWEVPLCCTRKVVQSFSCQYWSFAGLRLSPEFCLPPYLQLTLQPLYSGLLLSLFPCFQLKLWRFVVIFYDIIARETALRQKPLIWINQFIRKMACRMLSVCRYMIWWFFFSVRAEIYFCFFCYVSLIMVLFDCG